jgi:carbon starvation protein
MGTLSAVREKTLSLILPIYAFFASVFARVGAHVPARLPEFIHEDRRDRRVGRGNCGGAPTLKMPATTPFLDGGGPVVSGAVWPFVCIVIMCGALSGFHALVASGTTPKMIGKESHIRPIGYGAMLLEGVVAVTALIAACALEPGDYFAINVAQDTPAQQAQYATLLETQQTQHQWNLVPVELTTLEAETQEQLTGRVGGAVTLAVGMAKVFAGVPGMKSLMAYWYQLRHHVRGALHPDAARDGHARGPIRVPGKRSRSSNPRWRPAGVKWSANIIMSLLTCYCWGYLLYRGNLDTLWRMLGIANQLLANHRPHPRNHVSPEPCAPKLYALCTALPLGVVLVTVTTASVKSIGMWRDQVASALAANAPPSRFSNGNSCASWVRS